MFVDVDTAAAVDIAVFVFVDEGVVVGVDADVDVVANVPVNKSNFSQRILHLESEVEGGARYQYIPAIRNSIHKLLRVAWGTFWKTYRIAKRDSVVIVDCLNRVSALFALLASKIRGCRCVGIITDLPDMLSGSKFSVKWANYVIRHCTNYILLTDAMNEYIENIDKPYIVLEGHADIGMANKTPILSQKTNPRVCFYAGGISKQYGLSNLVEGFLAANLPNTELHIYGSGDYVEELKVIAENDSRVF